MYVYIVGRGDECASGSVRLVNGTDNSSGLVELCIFGFWEPVCGDSFTENEGMVACQQLGEYSDGQYHSYSAAISATGMILQFH